MPKKKPTNKPEVRPVKDLLSIETETLERLCDDLQWLSRRDSSRSFKGKYQGITNTYANQFISTTDDGSASIAGVYQLIDQDPSMVPERIDVSRLREGYSLITKARQENRTAESLNLFKWCMHHNFNVPF